MSERVSRAGPTTAAGQRTSRVLGERSMAGSLCLEASETARILSACRILASYNLFALSSYSHPFHFAAATASIAAASAVVASAVAVIAAEGGPDITSRGGRALARNSLLEYLWTSGAG